MSGWAVATWVAILVLVLGSLAVFAWFVRDLRRLTRGGAWSAGPPDAGDRPLDTPGPDRATSTDD
jgi:hypothetical protein